MKPSIIYCLNGNINDVKENIKNSYIRPSIKDYIYGELNTLMESIINYTNPNMAFDTTEFKDKILGNNIITDNEKRMLNESVFLNEPVVSVINNTRHEFLSEQVGVESIDGKIPFYFIFNGGDNIISNTIKKFTKGDFSHASVSTEGFQEIISFGTSYKNNGLMVESFYEFLDVRKPKMIGIHAIRLSPSDYEILRDTIEFYKRNIDSFKYSWKKLFLFPFVSKSELESEYTTQLICSEFCNYLLTNTAYNKEKLKSNNSIFVSPQQLRNTLISSSATDKIFEGSPMMFDREYLNIYKDKYTKKSLKLKEEIDRKIIAKYDSIEEDRRNKLKNRLAVRNFDSIAISK